ncbi:MAG: hypothetical protein LBC18_09605 [Opitutaceae bacterium]|jgi:hypothetical protein|nr:hypothetical protein [Opitutaceae bacterium]
MKTIKNIINVLAGNETVKSIVRHGLTLLGGFLVGKGLVSEGVSAWLVGGGFLTLAGSVWGAVNELTATEPPAWRHFWLSLVRHGLTAGGALAVSAGWLGEDVAAQLVGLAVSLVASFWGVGDEANAEAAAAAGAGDGGGTGANANL